jgi:hypothetical protein
VARDLNQLTETKEGQVKFDGINNGPKPVHISKPDAKSASPEAGTHPDDPADATRAGEPIGRMLPDGTLERGTGAGTGTTVVYDPKDWPRNGDPNSPSSAQQLASLLDNADQETQGKTPANVFSGQVPPKPPPVPPAPPSSGSAGTPAGSGSDPPSPAPPVPAGP